MISDDELLLYYYRELEPDARARIGAVLAEQPELAQRLHRLVSKLDAAAASPEVEVPGQFQQRWESALSRAAQGGSRPAARPAAFSRPVWLAAAAAVLVVAFVAVFTFTRTTPAPADALTASTPDAADKPDASAYENGLKWHLASTERRLASLDTATPEERARLVDAIIGQNRLYALAAERAGEPQLARVLRAFTPILEDVASGRSKSTEGDLAQLNFELRIMQARLGANTQAATTL
jgi:hypothetical protein